MTNRSKILLIIAVLFFSFSINSCKEVEDPSLISEGIQTNSNSDKVLDLLPEKFQLRNQSNSDDAGNLVLYHLMMNPHDPDEYFTDAQLESLRQLETENIASRQNPSLYTKAKLQELYSKEIINETTKNNLDVFIDEISAIESNNASVEDLWDLLSKQEALYKDREDSPEKALILSLSSSTKAAIQYHLLDTVDPENPNSRIQSGCFLGLKGSCWINVLTNTVFQSIVGAAAGGLTSDGKFWAGVKDYGVVAVAVNFVRNLWGAITGGSCYCNGTVSGCKVPTDFRVNFSSCDNSALFQPFPLDHNNGLISYTISQGTFPDFNNSSYIQTPDHSIVGKQLSNTQQIGISAYVTCTAPPAQGINTKYYDLYYLSRSPGPITVNGDAIVNKNWPERYTVMGPGTANSNNDFSGSVNFAGTKVGEGFTAQGYYYIDVNWNIVTTGSFNKGTIYINSTNECSSQVYSSYLQVTVLP